MNIFIVDDLRLFAGVNATYLRTLNDARRWLALYLASPYPVELWLDHDLGGDDDVRPFVRDIEQHLHTVGPLPITVRIITDNAVGRRWIRQALEGFVPITDDVVVPWRVVREEEAW